MLTLQQLLDSSGKDNVDALRTLYEGTFVCAQRLISLNLRATQSIMESNVSSIKAMMTTQGVPGFCETQSEIAHKLIQQTVGYAVDFNEVIAENQNELSGLLKARSGALTQAITSQATPEAYAAAGGTMMVDVVRTMLDAATDSRNYMLEMARQVDASVTGSIGKK